MIGFGRAISWRREPVRVLAELEGWRGGDHPVFRRGAPRQRRQPGAARRSALRQSGAVLDDVELFDAAFFGYSARAKPRSWTRSSACSWSAPGKRWRTPAATRTPIAGAIGVFAGVSTQRLPAVNLAHRARGFTAAPACVSAAASATSKDFLATRVSYKLDLQGPEHRRCRPPARRRWSRSHLACQSLLLASATWRWPAASRSACRRRAGYLHQEAASSRRTATAGRSTPRRDGTVGGNGAGVVVLKRLADALADGDHDPRGDPRLRASTTTAPARSASPRPSVDGPGGGRSPRRWPSPGSTPETIGYVEAHGTGTPLGDPIEVAALTQAFAGGTAAPGVLRARLGQDQHRPPGRRRRRGRADQDRAGARARPDPAEPALRAAQPAASTSRPAPSTSTPTLGRLGRASEAPRRAGVSAFGIGGTNAHVVLEEAPSPRRSTTPDVIRSHHLLILSARTPTALEAATDRLADHLAALAPAPTPCPGGLWLMPLRHVGL